MYLKLFIVVFFPYKHLHARFERSDTRFPLRELSCTTFEDSTWGLTKSRQEKVWCLDKINQEFRILIFLNVLDWAFPEKKLKHRC